MYPVRLPYAIMSEKPLSSHPIRYHRMAPLESVGRRHPDIAGTVVVDRLTRHITATAMAPVNPGPMAEPECHPCCSEGKR